MPEVIRRQYSWFTETQVRTHENMQLY